MAPNEFHNEDEMPDVFGCRCSLDYCCVHSHLGNIGTMLQHKKLLCSDLSGVRIRLVLTLEEASTPSEVSTSPWLKQMRRQMASVMALKIPFNIMVYYYDSLPFLQRSDCLPEKKKYTTEGVLKAISHLERTHNL